MHSPLLLLVVVVVLYSPLNTAHEFFEGKCPEFTAMPGFEWNKFAQGIWYVTHKFATKSSCLTYEFKTDEIGFKSIEQLRQLPYTDRVGLDHEYKYTGKLFSPHEANPGKMVVRFPLNPIGAASFVVLDTDYDSYGLICTCQDMDLFLSYAHRRSCSILQRSKDADPTITQNMRDKVDADVADASHDFDVISQDDCEYGKDKVWSIDVDKILALGAKGGSQIRQAVDSVASEFEFDSKPLEKLQEEAREIIENAE